MEKIKLNENWRMRCLNNGRISSEWQNAVVPGSVYTDLLRNHQIQDPYWKDNEDSVCALMEEEYEYECTFMNYGTDGYTDIYLEFEGLDTVADIYLNDGYVGHAENMHRIWSIISGYQSPAGMYLRFICSPPIRWRTIRNSATVCRITVVRSGFITRYLRDTGSEIRESSGQKVY